jgi:primase-polymerase (primpol)-like protein
MTSPDTLFTRSPDLPAGLIGDRWVAWKPDGRGKVPIGRDGRSCDPSHPRNWLPLDEARHVSRVFGDSGALIGYALSGSGLVALDFDRVIDSNTGDIAPEVRAHVDSFDTYAELSPSDLGLHLILAAGLPFGNRRIPGWNC